MDRRIEHFDEEIGIYWDKIKDHLYFPTFSGIENFVYISRDSKKFNGSMTKAGSSIIRRVCWEILSPPNKYIPKITEHMNKLKPADLILSGAI